MLIFHIVLFVVVIVVPLVVHDQDQFLEVVLIVMVQWYTIAFCLAVPYLSSSVPILSSASVSLSTIPSIVVLALAALCTLVIPLYINNLSLVSSTEESSVSQLMSTVGASQVGADDDQFDFRTFQLAHNGSSISSPVPLV